MRSATDEYPAMERGWEYIAYKPARVIFTNHVPPLSSKEEFIETLG